MFRGKAGTVVVKRRQKLHLLYRRDLQGGLQPVRGTAGGDVCQYGFVAVSNSLKIVPDDGGTELPVYLFEIPVDGGAHGGVQILVLIPCRKRIRGPVPCHGRIRRRDHAFLQCKQRVIDLVGGVRGRPRKGVFHVINVPVVVFEVVEDEAAFITVEV